MTSSSPSGQDRDVSMSQSSGHDGCDDCGHELVQHSSEPGMGCLHWDSDRVWCLCERAGLSMADQ